MPYQSAVKRLLAARPHISTYGKHQKSGRQVGDGVTRGARPRAGRIVGAAVRTYW
jgi:hypothetical protein